MAFRTVLPESELWSGEKLGLDVDGRKLLLVNVDGVVSAFEDRCAHQAWPLSRGKLVGRKLTCALHQWCYDARTGSGLNPAGVALRSYGVQVSDGQIWVDFERPGEGARDGG